ncbi:hypothetical protein PFISCL1PPCAC_9977 [Pristionchus fissidentatus]|uniref:SET domain-containing protein n=1 Tax=Pristionchus fissidentatus TaxID=1538716 RepID=A0AAV5VG73_9BILA|nr:hypothetical protein PFISCL1PPCAC_9977 [Pristionchus fissidentatus]
MDQLNSFFKETTCFAKVSRETDFFRGRNPLYPSLSAAVEVGYDTERQRFVRATQDIPVGKVVCVDEGVTCTFADNRCQFCVAPLKKNEKSFCARCRVDKRCKMTRVAEEGATADLNKYGMLEFGVRIVLSFPVEEIVQAVRNNVVPDYRRGFSSRSFLSIAALAKCDMEVPDVGTVFAKALEKVIANLSRHPEWSPVPDRKQLFYDALQFVMARVPPNAHSIIHPDSDPKIGGLFDVVLPEMLEDILWPMGDSPRRGWSTNPGVPLAVGFFPTASIVNHSCKANTFGYFHENRMIFVSRGIRAGQEVTDCYGPSTNMHLLHERDTLLTGRGFKCACVECRFERNHPEFGWKGAEKIDNDKTEELLSILREQPSYFAAVRSLSQLEKILPPFDVSLAHSYRIVAVVAAQDGKLSECISVLNRLLTAYSSRNSSFDPVTATTAHALALLHFASYQRTGDAEEAEKSQIQSFRALTQYCQIYGKHGILTRSILRFIKDRQMVYLDTS